MCFGIVSTLLNSAFLTAHTPLFELQVRFYWHCEDGWGAHIPVGGMHRSTSSGVLHATVIIEMGGQASNVDALMSFPSTYLEDGQACTPSAPYCTQATHAHHACHTVRKMSPLAVLMAHGPQADTARGKLMGQLASSLAAAGHLVVRYQCSSKEARRLKVLEKVLDAASTSPFARHVDRWLLVGLGTGARVAAIVGSRCRATVAAYAFLAYPVVESGPPAKGPATLEPGGPLARLTQPLFFVQAGADTAGRPEEVQALAPRLPSCDIRLETVQAVDGMFRDILTKASPSATTRQKLTAWVLEYATAVAGRKLGSCRLTCIRSLPDSLALPHMMVPGRQPLPLAQHHVLGQLLLSHDLLPTVLMRQPVAPEAPAGQEEAVKDVANPPTSSSQTVPEAASALGAIAGGFPGLEPMDTNQRRGKVVLVNEHRTSWVSSAVNGLQPCEEQLDLERPTRSADWEPPAGQVDHRLLRPAWSQQRDQPVRGTMWCLVVAPRKSPQPPCGQAATQPAASEPGPSIPPPAKRSKSTNAEQAAAPSQPTKGKGKAKGKAAKSKPAPQPGRWPPLELCWWPEQAALPAKGKEYPGLGYKRMPPKRRRKRPVSPAQSAAGASGSGQHDQEQGQGQAVEEVIGERRQVIKAAFRGLVEAARPDLSPAQVDAVVAEPQLQQLATATPAGTTLGGLRARILALKAAWDALWWLDWDTNGCLNFQRIGESMQRPLELCSWKDLEALPIVGEEYQQGYKRVNDRLPKVRQRLHRAAEYRTGWVSNSRGVGGQGGRGAAAAVGGQQQQQQQQQGDASTLAHPRLALQLQQLELASSPPCDLLALNLLRIGKAPWRPLELCKWQERGAAPAKGKGYPALGFKKLRDRALKAQAQQPVAQ
ncbi:hypothetical protein QJQ45_025702 [Haematococcus lacustris]|nr:hypothetical protein QJQ45_025702 [Haematococcus lacustris]